MKLSRKKENCLVEELLFLLHLAEWEYPVRDNWAEIKYKNLSIRFGSYTCVWIYSPGEIKSIYLKWWNRVRIRRAIRKYIKKNKIREQDQNGKLIETLLKDVVDFNKCK